MTAERRARIRARELTDHRVERMHQLLTQRDTDSIAQLHLDAIRELQLWSEIEIVPLQEGTDSDCSIAGLYLDDTAPPRIGIVRSNSRARENFTALHELGHHLQRTDLDLASELGDQPDRGRQLEEDTADRFAASVLIPSALTSRILGDGTPTAAQVVQLWQHASASRAAVCVAAARQLETPGHVLLLDPEGTVSFCATKGDYRLRRGSDQSTTEIHRHYAQSSRSVVATQTRFVYRDGTQGTELYAQATNMHGYTVVVAVTDHAPWEALSLSSTDAPVLGGWHECATCGDVFRSWERCERGCGGYRCTNGHCDCPTYLKEQICNSCFEVKPAHLFAAGSTSCTDCLN